MREFRTATKEELIEALNDLPDGALVAFASDYGDYTHTQQVHTITPEITEKVISETAYSYSGWALDTDAEPDDKPIDGEEKIQTVYIIGT